MDQLLEFTTRKEVIGPILTIFVGYIFYKVIVFLIGKISLKGKNELEKKRRITIIDLIQNICKYLIFIICILIILEIYGINTKSLITGLGIVGFVIGLALQDTFKDLIAGINIIMDNYYVKGDIIEINNFKGEVISFGLRTTKIKKFSGEVLTFANRNVDSIINYSQKSATLFYEIATAYEEKTQKIEKILIKLIPEIEKISEVKKGEVKYEGINGITDENVLYALSINCERNTQAKVKRLVNKIVKDAFDKNNIKKPYKQLEVTNAKSKRI